MEGGAGETGVLAYLALFGGVFEVAWLTGTGGHFSRGVVNTGGTSVEIRTFLARVKAFLTLF